MLNLALLKNPLNWFIVALMLVIAGFALDVSLSFFKQSKPEQPQ